MIRTADEVLKGDLIFMGRSIGSGYLSIPWGDRGSVPGGRPFSLSLKADILLHGVSTGRAHCVAAKGNDRVLKRLT